MAIANGKFPLIDEALIWEYHSLGERCVELLGSLFQKLWDDAKDFATARQIFEKVCANEKIDHQKFNTEEQQNRINFDVVTLENFINLKAEGESIIEKLEFILENEGDARECGKFLMGKALKLFLVQIRDFHFEEKI